MPRSDQSREMISTVHVPAARTTFQVISAFCALVESLQALYTMLMPDDVPMVMVSQFVCAMAVGNTSMSMSQGRKAPGSAQLEKDAAPPAVNRKPAVPAPRR